MPKCEFAFKDGGDDTVRCKLLSPNGNCCGNVKFCRMSGRWENNDGWKKCPVRKRGLELEGEKKNGKPV